MVVYEFEIENDRQVRTEKVVGEAGTDVRQRGNLGILILFEIGVVIFAPRYNFPSCQLIFCYFM